MRFILALIGVLLILPIVSAVGILVPVELMEDNTQYFEVGEEKNISFTIRGDAGTHDIEFFVKVISPLTKDYVLFNDEFVYNETIFLEAYEQEVITVVFEGLREFDNGSWLDVQYGFLYVEPESSEGIGFEQITANTFKARVKCNNCDANGDIYVYVEPEPVVTSESSGAGGGGGAYVFNNTTIEQMQNNTNTTDEPVEEVTISSIAGDSNTALSETIIPTGFVTSAAKEATQGSVSLKQGKGTLLLLIGLLVALMILQTTAIRVAKKEDEL